MCVWASVGDNPPESASCGSGGLHRKVGYLNDYALNNTGRQPLPVANGGGGELYNEGDSYPRDGVDPVSGVTHTLTADHIKADNTVWVVNDVLFPAPYHFPGASPGSGSYYQTRQDFDADRWSGTNIGPFASLCISGLSPPPAPPSLPPVLPSPSSPPPRGPSRSSPSSSALLADGRPAPATASSAASTLRPRVSSPVASEAAAQRLRVQHVLAAVRPRWVGGEPARGAEPPSHTGADDRRPRSRSTTTPSRASVGHDESYCKERWYRAVSSRMARTSTPPPTVEYVQGRPRRVQKVTGPPTTACA